MVYDADDSDGSSSPPAEVTKLVDTQFGQGPIDPSSDILHSILHLSKEWMQCPDFK